MRKPISFLQLGFGLFWVQLTWAFIALGIFTLIRIVQHIFSKEMDSFYSSGYIAGNIYMFVVGIIAIHFLAYSVENGMTRKNYFFGNVTASIALSIAIPIICYVIGLIEKFIVETFTFLNLNIRHLEHHINEIDMDGNIIGELVQSMILTPFIHPESNLFLSLALFSLHIFVFYMIGWLIGAAFQRLGVIGGLLFIIIGIALIIMKDSMVRISLDLPTMENFSALSSVPEYLALLIIFAVILIALLLIRLLTKRAPIKI